VLALTWTPGLSLVLLGERSNAEERREDKTGRLMAAYSQFIAAAGLVAGQTAVARCSLSAAGGGHLGRLSGAGL
jgi:hypothetical protein